MMHYTTIVLNSSMLIVALGVAAQNACSTPIFGLNWGAIPSPLLPFLIFGLRSTDLTLATLRTLTVIRGRRKAAWFLGFAQAFFFITAIVGVLENVNNLWNLIAYAAGFATGSVIGIAVEARLAPGHSLIRIISTRRGNAVLQVLHHEGCGATEILGQGMSGTVSVILCYVPRRQIEMVKQLAVGTDPEAFITVDHVRQLRGGWRA